MRRRGPNADREHQERPIAFDEDEAAELGAVVSDEPDTARRLSRLGDPVSHGPEAGTSLVDASKKRVDESVPDAVYDLEGQRASVTTAMSAPAAAAATPFFSASLI